MIVTMLSMIDDPKDKEKFLFLYSQYRDKMLALANQIIEDHALAENAVQEALIKIIPSLKKLKPRSKYTENFIMVVTKNSAIDLQRSKQKREEWETELLDQLPSMPEDLLEKLVKQEGLEKLAQGIERLPAPIQITLQLKYIHGYSSKEIAELLNISEKAVLQRLYRGKKQLRTIMKEEPIHEGTV